MSADLRTLAQSLVASLNAGAHPSGALASLIEAVGYPTAKQVVVVMYKLYSKRWAEALYALWQAKQVDRYGVAVLG